MSRLARIPAAAARAIRSLANQVELLAHATPHLWQRDLFGREHYEPNPKCQEPADLARRVCQRELWNDVQRQVRP